MGRKIHGIKAIELHLSSENDYLCNYIAEHMKEQSLSDWIEEKEMRGYYTFTIEEVQKNFPQFGNAYISTSLYRLTIKKKIISPWKGFYVIMPIEYALKAIIPPVFYIDALMVFLRKEYYIS